MEGIKRSYFVETNGTALFQSNLTCFLSTISLISQDKYISVFVCLVLHVPLLLVFIFEINAAPKTPKLNKRRGV